MWSGCVAFGVPIAAGWLIRLVLEPGYASAAYASLPAALALYLFGQRALLRHASATRLRLSLGCNFLAINLGYVLSGFAMNAHAGWRADAALEQLDRLLCHGDPQRRLISLRSPALSTIAILGYTSFVGYLVYLFLAEAGTLRPRSAQLQRLLMTLYGAGFCGYLLVPAAGPRFFLPVGFAPADQTALSAYLDSWVVRCCSRVDVWPSLHGAVCLLTLIWTWKHHRAALALFAPLSAALLFGAVYFQYHHVCDLVAGFILCLLIWFRYNSLSIKY